jgi:hypothetical protein
MNPVQRTGGKGFFSLSTQNVDNSVHVARARLGKKPESRMDAKLVKKVPTRNNPEKSICCAWNRGEARRAAGVMAASMTAALLLCTTAGAGSLAPPRRAPARRMSSGRRWL